MSRSRVVGLDVGTSAVRAAEVEFSGGGPGRGHATLARFAQVPLPPGSVQDAEVSQPETVATALKQLWRDGGFGSRDVVLGIGSQRVVVRDLELPFGPMTQLRASLPYQVQELLPMPVEEALLDYYPVASFDGPTGKTVRGLLVAASKDIVRMNVMAAESAGLRPQMVDLNAFALLRALARDELREQVVALVDVGARVTTVVIAAKGVPRFTRVVPSGGQDVTDAVAGHMKVSAAEAELLKREIGVGFAVSPDKATGAAAVAEVTRALVEAVRNTLVYYASNNPGAQVDQVLLSGGGAHLPGLGQYLATASRQPTSFGDPLRNMRVSSSAQSKLPGHNSVIAVAVGLTYGVAE